MKILGEITADIENDGTVNNPECIGGVIVKLTVGERKTLSMLQDAIDGNEWAMKFMSRGEVVERDMTSAFNAIYHYVKQRYAINHFQSHLDEMKRSE